MSIKKRLVALTMAGGLALSGALAFGVETASAAGPAAPRLSHTSCYGALTPTVGGLRLRTGPGTGYAALGLLYRGDRMTVIQHLGVPAEVRRGSSYWCHVKLTRRSASGLRSGRTGYVSASYVRHR